MAKELRVLELFSGIGGMHHALNLVGEVEVRADYCWPSRFILRIHGKPIGVASEGLIVHTFNTG